MSYDEVRTLLQMINIDLSDQYALSLFQVSPRRWLCKTRGPQERHPRSCSSEM